MIKYNFVIPTYNKKKYLKKTLCYIDGQRNYGNYNYEVIVVDDGSDDYTYEYIKGMNRNFDLKYIYIDRNENSCRASARNVGWKNARGEIVVFIDDDILINHDYLGELDRYYNYANDLVVIGTRINLKEQDADRTHDWSAITSDAYRCPNSDYLEFRHPILNSLSYNMSAHKYPWAIVYSCNFAVPRRILQSVGGFDEDFKEWGFEDVELGYRLSKNKAKIVINSKLEVLHQHHEKSRIGKHNYDLFRSKCLNADMEISKDKEYYFMPLAGMIRKCDMTDYYNFTGRVITGREVINFTNKSEINEIKSKIASYKKKGVLISVYDYVEDTDLDIWIQLYEQKDNVLLYFPVSKTVAVSTFSIIDRLMNGADI